MDGVITGNEEIIAPIESETIQAIRSSRGKDAQIGSGRGKPIDRGGGEISDKEIPTAIESQANR